MPAGARAVAASGGTVSWRCVPVALKTTVTELGDSRVRLQVEVPAGEVEGRLERKARQLGRELKLPGFRRGKVPAPLVIQRIGREVVLEEAVRDTLSSWYSDAIESAGIVPVGDPQLDLGELPAQGQALEFSIEIGVLPKAELGEYKGLEVARREPEVTDEQIQQEIDAMRERLARLQTAERPAAAGDFVVVDYVGSLAGEGSEGERARVGAVRGRRGRDQLVELGAGNLIPGFEEGLLGAAAGETRTVALTFPADYGNQELAGRDASFEITVKEVKLKELPELDDDFAIDAGFDDLEELREDIRKRLIELDEAAHRRRSSARPRSTPPSPPPAWRSRRSSSKRGRARCGSGCCIRSRTAASHARPTCRSSGARRRTSSPRWSPKPSWRCAARR